MAADWVLTYAGTVLWNVGQHGTQWCLTCAGTVLWNVGKHGTQWCLTCAGMLVGCRATWHNGAWHVLVCSVGCMATWYTMVPDILVCIVWGRTISHNGAWYVLLLWGVGNLIWHTTVPDMCCYLGVYYNMAHNDAPQAEICWYVLWGDISTTQQWKYNGVIMVTSATHHNHKCQWRFTINACIAEHDSKLVIKDKSYSQHHFYQAYITKIHVI